jgi:hypothetical protein
MEANSALALSLTEAIATYMKAKFIQQIQGSAEQAYFPSNWDFTLLHECDQAVGILLEAYRNPCMNIQCWSQSQL